MARHVNAPQLQIPLSTLGQASWDQMMANVEHHATNPAPQHQEQPDTPVKIYSYDVLINGKLKHTYSNVDEQKAKRAAHWRAKLAAQNGWPTMVRPSKAA